MKAQRRHDLKTNALARGLESLPEVGRQHGSKILVGILAVLLLVFLVRNRITSGRQRAAQAAYFLDDARSAISQLGEAIDMGMSSPQRLAEIRRQVATGAEDAVNEVLESTDDPRLIAEARLVRGDLNWQLANLPELPGAQTQPSLQFARSPDDLLKAAADAYAAVIDEPGSPAESVRTARFGLAAVAENRRQWDKAREQYLKIINDPQMPQPFKTQTAERLDNLERIQRPPLIGPPATTQATSETQPAIPRATGPAKDEASTATAAPTPAPAPARPPAPAPADPGAAKLPPPAGEQSSPREPREPAPRGPQP